ncbi:MAG: VOC family protein [Myxococcota bacterium]
MKFGYTIIYVPDVLAALTFYEAAFGFVRRFVHPSQDYGELATGETVLAFASEGLRALNGLELRDNRMTERAPGVEIVFVTDAVEQAMTRALDAGAAPVHAITEKPWGQRVGYVRDLNGVLIELCTPVGG